MAEVTETECIAALKANAGMVAHAAEKLGISRQALHQRIMRSPTLQAACEDIEETLLDIAQGHVAKQIAAGDDQTCRWYLQQRGKRRGFGSTEVTVRVEDDELLKLVRAFGGDVESLRRLRGAISAEGPAEPE